MSTRQQNYAKDPKGRKLWGDLVIGGQGQGICLGQAVDQWLTVCAARFKRSTCSTYRRVADRHIVGALGGCPVSDLTGEAISSYLSGRIYGTAEQPPLAPSTVHSILTVLRGALHYAERQGAQFTGWDALDRPRHCPHETQVLTAQERARLEEHILRDLDLTGLGVLLCLYTGLRIGELCALKWGDISEAGILTVRRTAQRIRNPDFGPKDPRRTIVVFDTPKSDSSRRSIPVPSLAQGWLERLRCQPDSYLLTGQADHFLEPRTMQSRFKKLLKAAGVRDINFHALRHTFATDCVQLGFDPKTLSQILGHSDVGVTLNTYVHPSLSTMRTMMERLNRSGQAGEDVGGICKRRANEKRRIMTKK